jgi:hypothetical protein
MIGQVAATESNGADPASEAFVMVDWLDLTTGDVEAEPLFMATDGRTFCFRTVYAEELRAPAAELLNRMIELYASAKQLPTD